MGQDISKENRKLYWIIAIFSVLCAALISTVYIGDKIETGNRGYLSGEAEWSKSQKEATMALLQYLKYEDEVYYREFFNSLEVIEGDRAARIELSNPDGDLELARRGLLQGNNHPDEVDAMIWVFRNFGTLDQVAMAIGLWERADSIVIDKQALAEEIRDQIDAGTLDEQTREQYYSELVAVNRQLSEYGKNFSNAMSKAARDTGSMIFWSQIMLSIIFILIAGGVAISFMRNLRNTHLKMMESDHKFRNVLDHSRDVIYQINIGSEKYDYMSTSVKEMLGFTAEEIMDGGPQMILDRTHPDDIERMKKKIEQIESEDVEEKLTQDSEFRVMRADGTYIWVNNKRSLLKDEQGNPVAVVGNVRDISVKKRQMDRLDKSLTEKQTLLAEIHHRVKNNLAIVSSLIELQKDGMDNEQQIAFRDVQSRIKSIALIHEKLYENTIFSEVELSGYLRELAEMISHTYHSEKKRITIHFDLEDVKVDMTVAVPVGLVCNELINNCFKHAFEKSTTGDIYICLRKRGTFVEVEVADNGDGLPESFSMENAEGLGITLLNVLTMQVRGEMKYESEEMTRFRLTFPVVAAENGKAEMQPV